ncbi:MAG: helix-turn-helix transcriptional regulator [Ktedonobacterales bacterium]|nr:helix-turn-helix transcriptional regulator [Ktedonobacterales bacterium]
MADLQQTVGEVIRHERRERRLTLKGLAERAIISVVYLGEIERGKKYPSPVVLERLAAALDMDVSDLLELIALELRGVRQPQVLRAIGFTQPARGGSSTSGRVINLLDVVAVA